MNVKRVLRVLVVGAACVGLVGCDWIKSWFSSSSAPIPVNITVGGGEVPCPLANVRLYNVSASVTTTSGQTLVDVSVEVACVMSGQRTPIPNVTLKVSGATLQPDASLGPTDADGKASRSYASSEAAAALVGRSFELRVVGSDGNPHPTSPATMVRVTQQ